MIIALISISLVIGIFVALFAWERHIRRQPLVLNDPKWDPVEIRVPHWYWSLPLAGVATLFTLGWILGSRLLLWLAFIGWQIAVIARAIWVHRAIKKARAARTQSLAK